MAYEKIEEMVEDLSCDELEIENKNSKKRKNKKECRLIIEKMREKGRLCVEEMGKEVCLECKMPLSECPNGKVILKEMEKK